MTFRQLLHAAGMTGYRLAKLSGVEQTTISQLELGKVRDPRWSTLAALALALNTTPGLVAKAINETPKRPASKQKVVAAAKRMIKRHKKSLEKLGGA